LESSALQEEIFFEEPKPRVLGKCFEKALATQEENCSLASSKVHERERERKIWRYTCSSHVSATCNHCAHRLTSRGGGGGEVLVDNKSTRKFNREEL
jgi:hypothetical protein